MIEYRLADADDDVHLRRLLASNAMPSWFEMTLEREPSFFAGATDLGVEHAVIARAAGSPEPLGMYCCAAHPVFLNGADVDVGYLGGLRVDGSWRHRIRVLRGGYQSITRLIPGQDHAQFWYTSIADDNTTARRLLGAGIDGMPTYQAVGAMTSLVLPASRGAACRDLRRAGHADIAELIAFYNRHARQRQFAPRLDEAVVRRVGVDKFLVLGAPGVIEGCVAVWDRQDHRQVVARRYRGAARALRPVYNLYASACRRVPLPRPGARLEHAFLAFFACEPSVSKRTLVRGALSFCRSTAAIIGAPLGGDLDAQLRRLASFRYATTIYTVSYGQHPSLAPSSVHPEVAVL